MLNHLISYKYSAIVLTPSKYIDLDRKGYFDQLLFWPAPVGPATLCFNALLFLAPLVRAPVYRDHHIIRSPKGSTHLL